MLSVKGMIPTVLAIAFAAIALGCNGAAVAPGTAISTAEVTPVGVTPTAPQPCVDAAGTSFPDGYTYSVSPGSGTFRCENGQFVQVK
jgi:hypothetical protein